MRFDDSVELLLQTRTLADLDRAMTRIVADEGLAAWTIAADERANLEHGPPPYRSIVSPTFIADYLAEGFLERDPVVARSYAGGGPFTWSSLPAYRRAACGRGEQPASVQVMRLAFDHGYRDGVAIPISGVSPHGRPVVGLCGLFSDHGFERRPDTRALIARMMGLAHLAQERLSLLSTPADHVTPLPEVILTDREIDCIRWAVRGKTVVETAHLLDIAPKTVTNHLTAAMIKLGAANKPHLVALALSRGLVVP